MSRLKSEPLTNPRSPHFSAKRRSIPNRSPRAHPRAPGALLVLAATCVAVGPAFANAPRPNIILMMADDLGYGDVGFTQTEGSVAITPNLDSLAQAGIQFTRFYAGGPTCSPTRATVLTGRHHFRHGVWNANLGRLAEEEIAIAEVLQQNGYATGHFGKWHLGSPHPDFTGTNSNNPAYPANFGYDEWLVTPRKVQTFNPPGGVDYAVNPYWHGSVATGGYGARVDQDEPNLIRGGTYDLDRDDSEFLVDQVIPFIRQAVNVDQKPFLVVLWFHTPHLPVLASEADKALFTSRQDYNGAIHAMDRAIGTLIEELGPNQLGVLGDTMVWFTSDNGPEDNNVVSRGGLRGNKRSLFNGGVNTPAFVHWPSAIASPRVESTVTSTLDYLPTILDTLELTSAIPVGWPIDGASLWPLLQGQPFARATGVPLRLEETHSKMSGSPTVAWIENDLKFLTNFSSHGYEDALYDVQGDHFEVDNLVWGLPEEAAAMETALADFLASAERSWEGFDYYPDPVAAGYTPANASFKAVTGTWRLGDPANFDPLWIANPFSVPSAWIGIPMNRSLVPYALDPEGGALTYALVDGPAWLGVTADGRLTGAPTALGLHSATVRCTDAAGGWDEAEVLFEVGDDPPAHVVPALPPGGIVLLVVGLGAAALWRLRAADA